MLIYGERVSAPNPPYGRRPVAGGPGSPLPTPPGGMPPHGRGPGPVGPPPQGPGRYRPAPYGPPPPGGPPAGTPAQGTPRQGPPPLPGPRPEPAVDPWRASAPTDPHHPGPTTPAPGGAGVPPGGPPRGGPGAPSGENPLIPPGVNGVPLPGPVPDVVQRAFLVWLVPIPLNVVAMLVNGLSAGDIGGLGVSIFGVLVALVGGAIGLYLALHFRGGRNWARIVLTVISGLVLAVELFSVPASLFLLVFAPVVGVISLAISVVIAAAEVLFLVLAWKAEASAYLR
jgi:hypothetical protein